MAKYIIVGGVAAGAAFAAKMRRLDERAEMVLFEKGPHVSYANCGLPYHVGGVIEKEESLLLHTPASLKARMNVDVQVNTEVLSINRANKSVRVKNLISGEEKDYRYDKLMLAPGGTAIRPDIPGSGLPEVFIIKDVVDTVNIKKFADEKKRGHVTVVGGGFIGLEMAENFHAHGFEVCVLEASEQVLPPFDYEMAAIVHNHMRDKGIDLRLGSKLKAIVKSTSGLELQLDKGLLHTDFVLMSIGVRPLTQLAVAAGLDIGATGGIKTNQYMQTSDPDIYAAGDAVEVTSFVTGRPQLVPLAGIANKQARAAAFHIAGRARKVYPVQGTAVVKVFDLTAAVTGSNEKTLKNNNIAYDKVYLHPLNHAGYYPGASQLSLKLLFSRDNGCILGAQVIGREGADKRIDVLSTAMFANLTIHDLGFLELAYAPPYSATRDPVNFAGDVAVEVVKNAYRQFFWDDCDMLDENKVFLVDARSPGEYKKGTIGKAVNIPLPEIRARLGEFPRDKDIYIFCLSGLRSYVSARILSQEGFTVYNLSGGYTSWEIADRDRKARAD